MVTPPSTPDRIPVNIITGFLGSGKTSAVLNLLKQKPPEEHWAILVNEFGEIGIDRSLMQAHAVTQDRVAILEVPGGEGVTTGAPLLNNEIPGYGPPQS